MDQETKEAAAVQEDLQTAFELQQTKRYLRPREIAAFVLNSTAQRTLSTFVENSRQFFFINFWGITGKQFGTMNLVTSIWDALDDPISGAVIDRMRTRWGRLRPFLIAPTPIWVFTTMSYFIVPWFLPLQYRFIYALVLSILNSIGFSYYGGFNILLYNMTPNTAERTNLITTQKFVELIASWIPSFVPVAFDLVPRLTGVRQQSVYGGFAFLFVVIGVAGSLFAFFRIRERVPLATRETMQETSIWKSFFAIARNRPLIVMLMANFFSNVKGIGGASESFFWLNNTGRLTNGTISGLFTGLPNYILTPIAPKLIHRFGVRNVAVCSGLFGGLAYTALFLIGYNPFGDSMGINMVYLIAMLTICGLPNTIMGVCNPVLTGDVYDYLEWKTGVRNEGLVNAVTGYIMKLSTSLIGLMQGMVLSWIHYVPLKDAAGNLVPQTDAGMLRGIFAVFALAPAIARFGYGLSMLLFNIHGKRHTDMLDDLARRRASKTVEQAAE